MKKRVFRWTLLLAGFIAVLGVVGLYAADFPDVIPMNESSYEHTKGIVEFSHGKHVDKYNAGCGECHHDNNGKPLTKLEKGSDVQKCLECHSKPGEVKGKDAKGLSAEEKRQYHANALHDNCRECHRDFNKKNKTKAAPTTCLKCHPKTK